MNWNEIIEKIFHSPSKMHPKVQNPTNKKVSISRLCSRFRLCSSGSHFLKLFFSLQMRKVAITGPFQCLIELKNLLKHHIQCYEVCDSYTKISLSFVYKPQICKYAWMNVMHKKLFQNRMHTTMNRHYPVINNKHLAVFIHQH